jgi:acetyl esterase/lipase
MDKIMRFKNSKGKYRMDLSSRQWAAQGLFIIALSVAVINAQPASTVIIAPLWPQGQVPGQVTSEPEELLPSNDGVIRLTNVSRPSLSLYQADTTKGPSPAVLVCPGGGYSRLAMDKEGTEVAQWLNSCGVSAIVLKYRVPQNRSGALQDVQRAMGLIRQNAQKWNIDSNHIGVMGFSAGGHLSASLSTNYQKRNYEPIDPADQLSCRPDFTILIYPAYLSKDNYQLPEDMKVTDRTPPAFILQTQDDKPHVDSSIAYYLALKKADIPAELHLFPSGGHGYGLRPSEHAVCRWPLLCGAWLKKQME